MNITIYEQAKAVQDAIKEINAILNAVMETQSDYDVFGKKAATVTAQENGAPPPNSSINLRLQYLRDEYPEIGLELAARWCDQLNELRIKLQTEFAAL